MKRKELQAPCLPVFQAKARAKLLHITMPEYSRSAITKAINEVRLPLREVANLNKSEMWHKFTNRLISGCISALHANSETERILKEFRITLNQ